MAGRNLFAEQSPRGRNLFAQEAPVFQDLPADFKPEMFAGEPEQSERPFDIAALRTSQTPATGEPRRAAGTVSALARPLLETGLATAGAVIGTPATPGPGTLAGGGLGFAIGAELADHLDEFLGLRERQPLSVELTEAGKDVAKGAAFEAGGQSLVKVAVPVAKAVAGAVAKIPSKASAIKEAGEIIAANTSSGPIIAKNIEEARVLEEAIPGLKFSRGQATGDPAIIKFERARARMPGEVAAQQAEQTAKNTAAVREFISKQKGAEGIEDAITPLLRQQESVESAIAATGERLGKEAARLTEGLPATDAGKVIREELRAAEKEARRQAGELFEQVPEFEINASRLLTKIEQLSKPLSKFEDVGKNIPEEFGFYKEVLEGGPVTPQDLQGLRSQVAESIRDAKQAATPNNRKVSRLTQLLDEVDSVLAEAGVGEGTAASALKTAQKFFRKEVIEKFRKGTTSDVLKQVAKGDKITNANVASSFFKPGPRGAEAVQEFMSSVGDKATAKKALVDFVQQDLIEKAVNPSTGEMVGNKLKTWLAKNNHALTELGIKENFSTIQKASDAVEQAFKNKAVFDKSVASKLLNSDVGTEVKNAFAKGSKKAAARQLVGKLKGDKKALSGLQNATIDHIITQAETTAVDAFKNPIVSVAALERESRKFGPALEVLFEGAPDKLKALELYKSTLRTLQRTEKSPLGGGSDTFENIMTALSKASGITSLKSVNIAKAFLRPISEMREAQVNALLNRAAFDPDFAKTLIDASKGKPADQVIRRLQGHIASLTAKEISPEE